MAKVIEFCVPKNFRKPFAMGSSVAPRKGYRVLLADKEISLAQPIRCLETCRMILEKGMILEFAVLD
ncbi:MAG: hypothetical protein WB711_13370 [Terriglobales bacterium]